MTRENVMKGMQILVQAKIPISRPDDFFAEMLKSDEHMAKVKSRLLQQQQKVQTFEEKKSRLENKKFHKAIKAYKQTERHQEKRENFKKIDQLKKKINESKGNAEVDEREFNKLFNGGSESRGNGGRRQKVIDRVKDSFRKNKNSKHINKKQGGNKTGGQFKKSKRPGKVARNKRHGGRR